MGANTTRVTSRPDSRRPARPSATPVTTSWPRPASKESIRRASARSFGLPSASPSTTTSVSAATTRASGAVARTAAAFSRARRSAPSKGDSPSRRVSSTSDARTSNDSPIAARISRRRGDEEASRMRGFAMAQSLVEDHPRTVPDHNARMPQKSSAGIRRARSGTLPALAPAARLAAAEAALERGAALADLVLETSNAFVRAPAAEIDAQIAHALGAFGLFLGADAVTLWLVSEDAARLAPAARWHDRDVVAPPLEAVPVDTLRWSV